MNKKTLCIISIISLILAIMVMCMIFVFSSQNAEKSSSTSGVIVDTAIDVTIPDYDDKPIAEKEKIKSDYTHYIRKLAHFTEFMLLGIFLMLHVRCELKMKNRKWPFDFAIVTSFGFIYALSDEFHQGFTEGRGPMFTDCLIDTTGVITGVFIVMLIFLIVSKIMDKKTKKEGI